MYYLDLRNQGQPLNLGICQEPKSERDQLKLNKNITKLSLLKKNSDDDYVDAPIVDKISMVWEITEELWSLTKKGELSAKSRLQRNVANLTKARR